jgi:antitoxin ParD1/3/4
MNVSLTPELAAIVQAKVESGLYNNASEFVRDAIRQFDVNAQMLYELKLARLKEALAPGLKSAEEGKFADYSLEKINARLDAKRKNNSSV